MSAARRISSGGPATHGPLWAGSSSGGGGAPGAARTPEASAGGGAPPRSGEEPRGSVGGAAPAVDGEGGDGGGGRLRALSVFCRRLRAALSELFAGAAMEGGLEPPLRVPRH